MSSSCRCARSDVCCTGASIRSTGSRRCSASSRPSRSARSPRRSSRRRAGSSIEGPDGILAAIRMGVWSHAPAYAAVFACYLLLSGVGRTHERRAVALHRRTRATARGRARRHHVPPRRRGDRVRARRPHGRRRLRRAAPTGWGGCPPVCAPRSTACATTSSTPSSTASRSVSAATRRGSGPTGTRPGTQSGDPDVATLIADPGTRSGTAGPGRGRAGRAQPPRAVGRSDRDHRRRRAGADGQPPWARHRSAAGGCQRAPRHTTSVHPSGCRQSLRASTATPVLTCSARTPL